MSVSPRRRRVRSLLRFVFDHGPCPVCTLPTLTLNPANAPKNSSQSFYIPPSAVKDYLTRIIKELAIKILASAGQSLFTLQTIDLIKTISARYNVQPNPARFQQPSQCRFQSQPSTHRRSPYHWTPRRSHLPQPNRFPILTGEPCLQCLPCTRLSSMSLMVPLLIVSVAADSVTFLCN